MVIAGEHGGDELPVQKRAPKARWWRRVSLTMKGPLPERTLFRVVATRGHWAFCDTHVKAAGMESKVRVTNSVFPNRPMISSLASLPAP